jgi:hypothetical protein
MFLVLVFRLLGARKVLEGTRGMIVLFSYFFNGYTDGRLLKRESTSLTFIGVIKRSYLSVG